jgi:hypothetical protein
MLWHSFSVKWRIEIVKGKVCFIDRKLEEEFWGVFERK